MDSRSLVKKKSLSSLFLFPKILDMTDKEVLIHSVSSSPVIHLVFDTGSLTQDGLRLTMYPRITLNS